MSASHRSKRGERIKCVIGVWDLHSPFEDPDVLDIFMQFAHKFKPQILCLGGDNLDCSSISSHEPSARVRCDQPFDRDIRHFDEVILKPFDRLGATRKLFFIGNHCQWIADYSAKHPELGSLLDIEERLELQKRNWTVVPYKQYAQIGRLWLSHGDFRNSRKGFGGGGKHHSYNAAMSVHRPLRYGHSHSYQAHTIADPVHPSQPISAVCVPCGCLRSLPYLEGGAVAWTPGFWIAWVKENGEFSDYCIHVQNGRTNFAGVEYVSRTRGAR